MTKYQLSRPGTWDYPSFGFTATDGAILDGTLSTPVVTSPPDAFWTVYGGAGAETGITRYTNGVSSGASPEPADGAALVYNATSNAYEATSAALSATYVAHGRADAHAQRVDAIRRGKLGVVGTSGKAAIAIRIDHQLDPFLSKVQPVLTARALPWGIGLVTGSVGNPSALYEPTTATWTDVKNSAMYPGGEIWAHSRTHSDGVPAYGGTSLTDEIVGAKADLEAQGIRVMGWQQPGGPATYGTMTSVAAFNSEAGNLIRDTYGLYESYLDGTVYRALPTNGCRGLNHQTIDTYSLASFQALVDRAVDFKVGVEVMLHPLNLDLGGYMTMATFTSMMDYLVTKRDAGLIEVLTPSGLAFADLRSDQRTNLFAYGTFEGQSSASVPPSWALDTPSWTINTDGGHGGSNYLRVPTSQSLIGCRSPIGQMGASGFTFMFEGWCRSNDVGGATYRVNIQNRGAVNTTMINKTAALAQSSSWTRVRVPFTCPIQETSDLLVLIGRLSGGWVDWDDVTVTAI